MGERSVVYRKPHISGIIEKNLTILMQKRFRGSAGFCNILTKLTQIKKCIEQSGPRSLRIGGVRPTHVSRSVRSLTNTSLSFLAVLQAEYATNRDRISVKWRYVDATALLHSIFAHIRIHVTHPSKAGQSEEVMFYVGCKYFHTLIKPNFKKFFSTSHDRKFISFTLECNA